MDARAPAVVALMVARDPGPWFEEALASLGAQDYAELSVLVVAGAPPDGDGAPAPDHAAIAGRVAAVLPDAFVRSPASADTFGAAVNDGLPLVEGAAFFLLCHDDVALEPDALHLMVEESFRSNAAVVTPKTFRWEQPDHLLHVGMGVDRYGVPVDRVQEDEVDHGQHDAVREVFAAPGGATLVRADLLAELGGFDVGIRAFGEDMDLSWRVQVAGGRIVVAPRARCRHLEAMASGRRSVPEEAGRRPTRQELERRHELRTLLKCSSYRTLLVILPRLLVLTLGELVISAVTGDGHRARAVSAAWSWNLRHLGELRRLHAAVARRRAVPDRQLHRVQTEGSVRRAAFASRLEHSGLDVVRPRRRQPVPPPLTGTVGHAFSEDIDFDELDDLGRRYDPGRRGRTLFGSSTSRLTAWIVAAVVLVIGTRSLITGGFPLVGQFVPFPSWTAAWHQFAAGWQPAGVGSGAPATPAYALIGAIGTVLIGGMGLTQKVMVLACFPLGVWGLVRLLRPWCSARARLIAGIAYLGLALPYDALARGRFDGLVAYALVPWMLGHLAAVAEAPPGRLVRPILALGALDAVAIALVPALGVVLLVAAVCLWVGGWAVGRPDGGTRVLAVAVGATAVALVLCLPWVVGVLASGRGAIGIFGATSGPWAAPSVGALLRFDVGPVGGTPLSWLIPIAALLPLLLGRGDRLAWSGRLWTVAVGSWVLAWVVGRGLAGSFSPGVDVLLAPAAAAVAASIGLGMAAFESDLSGFAFGWRQLVSAGAVVILAVGLLPVLVEAGDGQWGLPSAGYAQPLSWLSSQHVVGGYRVLWLGDPSDVPGQPWRIDPGLAFTTSFDGTPQGQNLYAPASPGAATQLAEDVQLAMAGRTSHLGQLLASAAVRYVVVVDASAPQPASGGPTVAPATLSGALLPALERQGDLTSVPTTAGLEVFQNASFVPARVHVAGVFPIGVLGSGTAASSYRGRIAAGPLVSSFAPASAWSLTVGGTSVTGRVVHGWESEFATAPAGEATLSASTGPLVPLGVAVEVVLWIAAAAVLTGVVPALLRRRRAHGGRRVRGSRDPRGPVEPDADHAAPPPVAPDPPLRAPAEPAGAPATPGPGGGAP